MGPFIPRRTNIQVIETDEGLQAVIDRVAGPCIGSVDGDRGITCLSCGWISDNVLGAEPPEAIIAEWRDHQERSYF